jgi:hypothetical protein
MITKEDKRIILKIILVSILGALLLIYGVEVS